MTKHVYKFAKAGNYMCSVADATTRSGKRAHDLGTPDYAEALVRAAELASSPAQRAAPPSAVRGASPVVESPPFVPVSAPSSPPPPPPPRPGEDKMRALFARDAGVTGPTVPMSAPEMPAPPGATTGDSMVAPGTTASGRVILDDGEAAKLAEMSATVAVQLNSLLVGATIKVFGRRPDEPDEDWERLNHKGWTAMLRKLVGNREASALAVIAVSSLGMGLQMYAGGEALPPAEKPEEEDEAKLRILDGAATAINSPPPWKFRDDDDDDAAAGDG